MSILKYGSTTISPTPVVVIDRQPVGNVDGALQGTRATWRLSGEVIAATPALVQTGYAALQTLFDTPAQDLILYADDGATVKHQLINSQCLHGVKITKPLSYPKGEGAELATLRTWSAEISGVVLLAGAPSATATGDWTRVDATGIDGQIRITISGTFRGPGAAAAAVARKLTGMMVISEEERTNADTQEVSFTYSYVDPTNSRGLVSRVESTSLEYSLDQIVFRKPLNSTPIMQTTVTNTARASQSGEAVGLDFYPVERGPIWSTANLTRRRVGRRCGTATKDGQVMHYVTIWEYEFEFAATPLLYLPADPV